MLAPESWLYKRREKFVEYGIMVVFILSSLAYALILPPYEGFDETAHYSYISYLAATGKIPDFTKTKIDASIEEDQKLIPKPYNCNPPFENNSGITYHQYFNNMSIEDHRLAYQRLWLKKTSGIHYKEGKRLNWQAQHPPLYYSVMLAPYFVSKNWPSGYRLMFLRLFSLVLVWFGLYICVLAIRLFDMQEVRIFFLSGMTALLFFPSLYFDLARVGNDSMAALLASLCFYFIIAIQVNDRAAYRNTICLSLTIGLGLLTKMFYIPVMAACIAFIIYTGIRRKFEIKQLLIQSIILVLIPLAISGWWFNIFHARYGMYFGSEEFYSFGQSGAAAVNLSLFEYIRQAAHSVMSFTKTFLWCGSWSWLKLPYWYYVVFAPLPPLILYSVFWRWKKVSNDIRQVTIAAILILTALLAGFVYHMYTRITFTGIGTGTGGYYLFIVWPFLAVILSYIFVLSEKRMIAMILSCCFVLIVLFETEGFWRELLLYSGIINKSGSNAFGNGYILPSLTNIKFAIERCQQLTFSFAATTLFIISTLIKIIIMLLLLLKNNSELREL